MILLQENIQINNGLSVSLYYAKSLVECNATALMLTTFAELLNNGHSTGPNLGFNNESQVIWAELDNKPIGGICFTFIQKLLQSWINFSFTDPGYRGLGINKICHTELEKLMRTNGLKYIASHVHVDNLNRINSCKKVGMQATFYRMSKTI